jgi:hypothetical protein
MNINVNELWGKISLKCINECWLYCLAGDLLPGSDPKLSPEAPHYLISLHDGSEFYKT